MDPDVTLADIREHVKVIEDEFSTPASRSTHGEWLAERVRQLDEWLSRGGFPPNAWNSPPATTTEHMHYNASDDPRRPRVCEEPSCGAAVAPVDAVAEIRRELNAHPTWCHA